MTSQVSTHDEKRPFSGSSTRWELYRLLADPVRLKLLALAAEEELGVSELAELLRESQPKTSRHAAALREASLLAARRQGTWTLLRLAPGAADDPVVADALAAGREQIERDGTLRRVDDVLQARDLDTREFFARGGRPAPIGPPPELAAYLSALAPLLPHRRLAIDAGTGDGALLEVLAPLFENVVAIDRSDAQIRLAQARVDRRGFNNVELVCGELDGPEVKRAVGSKVAEGADVVFAARVLHHAPKPARAMQNLVDLARRPDGQIIVLDYAAHDDAQLRDQQADLWLGFTKEELSRFAKDAALSGIQITPVPSAWRGEGTDRHLPWQILTGKRPH